MLPAGTNTNAEWARLMGKLASLLEKLAGHEAMKDNMKQPYMTPAASKNRIYFVWDFVGRTMVCLIDFLSYGCFFSLLMFARAGAYLSMPSRRAGETISACGCF